ncbi:SDR family NAD(P)-dependent oxidoreductase [Fluviicola sp.]|uniref:SDR family NAD(P)-dependent oxidoreductase n=1 Tax=Fluviicola sp. TaxID=1917219 RepID=UPI00281D6CE5|nr:SDR family NAD(P)-dependent oxidoreductase [Fluviicola sp.]MDR0801625.1 SDR family NAD(P)-dependent oxidoreductase [Fluviicola sp.]
MNTPAEIIQKLKNKTILVTGGAGFIGSNLTEALLKTGASVIVLDNLETGLQSNIDRLCTYEKFRFVKGDISNPEDYRDLLREVDAISNQAALGSVPRSIEFPLNTHRVNATGFLTILHEAKQAGVKRFVYASSSSVYGDSTASPKHEGQEGNVLSPYAATKQLNEEYGRVYHQLHGMETIGLRYFNVFGPYQNPNGVYAAAIPKFLDKMLQGGEIVVNGDGEQSRDFTYVYNAVHANMLSLISENEQAFGQVYNVACGHSLTLNNVIHSLQNGLKLLGREPQNTITYGPPRQGDIKNSLASTAKIEHFLKYKPVYTFEKGIQEYLRHILQCK